MAARDCICRPSRYLQSSGATSGKRMRPKRIAATTIPVPNKTRRFGPNQDGDTYFRKFLRLWDRLGLRTLGLGTSLAGDWTSSNKESEWKGKNNEDGEQLHDKCSRTQQGLLVGPGEVVDYRSQGNTIAVWCRHSDLHNHTLQRRAHTITPWVFEIFQKLVSEMYLQADSNLQLFVGGICASYLDLYNTKLRICSHSLEIALPELRYAKTGVFESLESHQSHPLTCQFGLRLAWSGVWCCW